MGLLSLDFSSTASTHPTCPCSRGAKRGPLFPESPGGDEGRGHPWRFPTTIAAQAGYFILLFGTHRSIFLDNTHCCTGFYLIAEQSTPLT